MSVIDTVETNADGNRIILRAVDVKRYYYDAEGTVTKALDGVTLEVCRGEYISIMGPSGSGKSTLSYTLAGREGYDITSGSILYKGEELAALTPDARAAKGFFLALQYPVEIPGVSTIKLNW